MEVSDIREKVEWRLLSLSSLLDLERLVMAAVFVVVAFGGVMAVLIECFNGERVLVVVSRPQ